MDAVVLWLFFGAGAAAGGLGATVAILVLSDLRDRLAASDHRSPGLRPVATTSEARREAVRDGR